MSKSSSNSSRSSKSSSRAMSNNSSRRAKPMVPKATNSKSEATVLKELLVQISTDKGNNYKQFYYPAASECYAYQPDVKDGEVLLDKFKAHHWWLPSEGELARMYYYHSHGYDTTKDDTKAIFAQASDSGTVEQFGPWDYLSSTEYSSAGTWRVAFSNGSTVSHEGYSKYHSGVVRSVCAF